MWPSNNINKKNISLFLVFITIHTMQADPLYPHPIGKYSHPLCKAYGAFSYGHPAALINFGESAYLYIGKFCSIANGLVIFLGGDHRTDWISTYPFMSFNGAFPEAKHIQGHPKAKGDVIIGNDVWIGDGVTIMSGVTIGDGAVIGTKSVVCKNVPPYAIFAGNPARLMRYRFEPETIEALLALKWWDWPIEKIRQNVALLCSINTKQFIGNNLDMIKKHTALAEYDNSEIIIFNQDNDDNGAWTQSWHL